MQMGFHRQAIEGIAAKALYLLTRLAIPPMVLGQIGLGEYGLWSIAFVLVGYLGLSVSGLATVYVREVAQAYQRQDAEHASGMLSTGVAIALLVGSVFCVSLTLIMPSLLRGFDVAPALAEQARLLILVTSLVFLADLTLGAWGYVLHGLHRVHEQQRIWVASFMLEWLMIAILLYYQLGLTALLAGFIARYCFSIALAWWRVHRVWPQLRLHPSCIRRSYLSPFLHFGLKTQLSDTCAMILHSVDRMVAGLYFGSAATAIVDLGGKLPATATSIASGVSAVVLPRSACMSAAQVAELYAQALRLSTFALLWLMPLLVACAPAIHIAWLGLRVESAQILALLLWLTPAWHCHVLTGSASSALRGQGQVRLEYVYHALRLAALGVAIALAADLVSFIAALAIGNTVAALSYLMLASQRLALGWVPLWRICLRPVLGAYLLAYSFVWLWPWQVSSRAMALSELVQAGAVFSMIFVVLVWKWGLTQAERVWVGQQCSRPFKREAHHA